MSTQGLNHKIGLWAFLLLHLLWQKVTLAATGEMEYRFERMLPQQAQSWNFYAPESIVAAPDDSIWVIDNQDIKHFNADGTFIDQLIHSSDQNGISNIPKSIAAATDNSIWIFYKIPESTQLLVQHLSANGVIISQFKVEDPSGKDFIYPVALALAKDSSLWTLSNNHIQHFKNNGAFISQFGSEGTAPGQLSSPNSIALSTDGSIWVTDHPAADTANYRVQHFTPEGKFINQFEVPGGNIMISPPSVAVANDGSVWIANSSSHHLDHFSPEGTLMAQSVLGKAGPLGTGILSIAVAPQGSVWVADDRTGCLYHFNSNGGVIANFCSLYSDDNSFFRLGGITTAPDNSIWILDLATNFVQHINAEGIRLSQFGYHGVDFANHIALTENGNIWIGLHGSSNSLQKFNADGTFFKEDAISGKFLALEADGSFWSVGNDQVVAGQSVQHFGADGQLLTEFNSFNVIQSLELASDGSIWVFDSSLVSPRYSDYRVQHLGSDGTNIASFILHTGTFIRNTIYAIALAPDDTVWVALSTDQSSRIQHFNSDGSSIGEIGSVGKNAGQFILPIGQIAIAPDNSLWVIDSNSHRLQKFVARPKSSTVHPYKAIILAGGVEKIDNHINGFWQIAQKANNALSFQGFNQYEEILFLTAGNTQLDIDGNGQKDDLQAATKNSLRHAITEWAKDSTDVVLFLAGQTHSGQFQLSATETFTAQELSGWLADLEKALPANGKVTVVIEAPDAGSFVASLANPSRPRYVIASTQAKKPALMEDHGVNSFSYTFWSRVMDGAPLADAFVAGQQAIEPFIVNRQVLQPTGDANGNGQADAQDAAAVGNYCLGMCNKTASPLPAINLPGQPSLAFKAASSLDFNVNVRPAANTHLLETWALVQRPAALGADPANALSLEKIPLSCDTNQHCTGRYQRFDAPGQYRVHFYALDSQYQLNAPAFLDINIQPENTSALPAEYDSRQGLLTLRDVETSGQHYQAALQYQDGLYYLLTLGLTPNLLSPAARFDAATNLLDIPLARVNGQDYQASFRLVDNYLFQLLSTSPK